MVPCCKSCKKLVLIEVLEKCPNEIGLLFEQFLKIKYRHWISHLKEMSPPKKVTKKVSHLTKPDIVLLPYLLLYTLAHDNHVPLFMFMFS